jgi:hypothetical protein
MSMFQADGDPARRTPWIDVSLLLSVGGGMLKVGESWL